MPAAAWKREVVQDHKFDFIDVRDFTTHTFVMRLRYLWVYILVLKGFLIYISDIFTAVTRLSTDTWSKGTLDSCTKDSENSCIIIPFEVAKWLFVGCIIFSFLLLAYESWKANKIVASRDISYAYTNVLANNYYSLRSYDTFCFFSHLSDSTKKKDDFAFFIFFTFKEWKRVLLADGPRQVINALLLYSIFLSKKDVPGDFFDINRYTDGDLVTTFLYVSMLFTVLVFAGSLLLLIAAGICYIPLLCYIRGNLKEYVCHKVDKRIAELMKRKQRQRLAEQAEIMRKEAAGDFSHLKNKKGELAKALPQPTLPTIALEDDFDDAATVKTRGGASQFSNASYWPSDKKDYHNDYPPMPHYQQGAYAHSVTTLPEDGYQYSEQAMASTAHLTSTAAPIAGATAQHTLPDAHYQHTAYGEAYSPDEYAQHYAYASATDDRYAYDTHDPRTNQQGYYDTVEYDYYRGEQHYQDRAHHPHGPSAV